MSRVWKISAATVLALGVVFGGVSVVGAADAPAAAAPAASAAEGKIKSYDAAKNTFVITVKEGEATKDITVTVNDKTTYTLDGKDAKAADALKAGNSAKVTHSKEVASKVEAKAAAAAAH